MIIYVNTYVVRVSYLYLVPSRRYNRTYQIRSKHDLTALSNAFFIRLIIIAHERRLSNQIISSLNLSSPQEQQNQLKSTLAINPAS